MTANVKRLKPELEQVVPNRPTREEAEAAVRTLIAWAGDNPDREGLRNTPRRVVNAYGELYSGYDHDPAEVLTTTFKEVGGYQDMVLVRDVPFYSHCEHHMVPFMGKAHIGYYPVNGVVGLSKLARLLDIYRPPPADAGDADGADFRRARGVSRHARRRDHAGGRASVHVDAGRPEGRRLDHDVALHRHLQGRRGGARKIPEPPPPDLPVAARRLHDMTSPADQTAGLEESRRFTPRFDADGLMPCVTVDAASGDVLMVAWMNAEALRPHAGDRARPLLEPLAPGALEEGRNVGSAAARGRAAHRLRPGRPARHAPQVGERAGTCHTGRPTCFYRSVPLGGGPIERAFATSAAGED